MEFTFNIHVFLKDEITIIDRNHDLLRHSYTRYPKENAQREELRELISKLGVNSAQAQALNGAITSAEQLLSYEQRCYILKDIGNSRPNGVVIGFLKVGAKKLFFVSPESQQVEVTPLCVLDFYVHESCQRQGHGYKLFKYMMEKENVAPGSLAIDRPSEKMLAFYKKRFSLSAPIKQPNNFVVFRDFFSAYVATSSKRWTDQQRRGPITLKAISRPPVEKEEFAAPKPTLPPIKATRTVPTHPNNANEFQLPSLFDRPLSSLLSSSSTSSGSNHGNSSSGSRKVTPPIKRSPPNKCQSKETTFSWSRNNLNINYIVGGASDTLLQSRYSHFNKPRPF